MSRTISYAVLTVVLVGLYAAGALSLGAIGPTATGEVNDLVVALSTLLVAGAFQPLRRRVQAVVDRRFDRARYDAARTSELFAQRVRDPVDLAHLRDDLRVTVHRSLAPSSTSVWLLQETVRDPIAPVRRAGGHGGRRAGPPRLGFVTSGALQTYPRPASEEEAPLVGALWQCSMLSFLAVGTLIAGKRPRSPMGWLLLWLPLMFWSGWAMDTATRLSIAEGRALPAYVVQLE